MQLVKPKSIIARLVLATIICAFTQSIVVNITSKYFLAESPSTVGGTLKGIYIAFMSIFIYGVWLLYLPGFAIFQIIIDRYRINSLWAKLLTGILVGILYAAPVLLLRMKLNGNWLEIITSIINNIRMPAILGLVYAFLHYLHSKDIND